jgi:hypothetical protein
MNEYDEIRRQMREVMKGRKVKTRVSRSSYSTEYPFISGGKSPWPHFSYQVSFASPTGKLSTPYRMGASREEQRTWDKMAGEYVARPARAPIAEEVLGTLCADASEAHNHSFEDWASNLGYDTDSRRAERIYLQCCASFHDLAHMLGEDNVRKLAELSAKL